MPQGGAVTLLLRAEVVMPPDACEGGAVMGHRSGAGAQGHGGGETFADESDQRVDQRHATFGVSENSHFGGAELGQAGGLAQSWRH